MLHVRKIQSRIHAVSVHVHSHGHDIHIPGTLPVPEQRPFNTVCTCQDSQFCRSHTAAAVIVGMQAENHIVSVIQMLVHILQLTGKHMGHGILYRGGNINDCLIIRRRFPDVQNRIADLHRIVHLRPRETFGTVLEGKVSVRLGCQFCQKLRTLNGNLLDLLPALTEYLFPLGH